MQKAAEVQETLARTRVCGAGLSRGTGSACQVRPSQCAATGRRPSGGPTAWQEAGPVQDRLLMGPAAGMTAQRAPFHACAGAPSATQEVKAPVTKSWGR